MVDPSDNSQDGEGPVARALAVLLPPLRIVPCRRNSNATTQAPAPPRRPRATGGESHDVLWGGGGCSTGVDADPGASDGANRP